AGDLRPGDRLATAAGDWLPLDSVTPAANWTTVYNFRVANYHTYFVAPPSCDAWVWVHNAYTQLKQEGAQTTLQITNKFAAGSYESRQLQRFVKAWNEEIEAAGGTLVRRTLTDADHAAARAWRDQMIRQYPSRFAGKVVGHVPDAAAGGPAAGGRAMALSQPVNSFLGGILSGVPIDAQYNAVKLVRQRN
ncbi:MAG: polymorphic toxin-type HINT domain-containing protein, partial [Planctomycetota bacterium]